tara:strand:- start:1683 stop:1937 length:255 start_codon:yes stop_codon:yes gene_type:complete
MFKVGDLVCYKASASRQLCGIITEINNNFGDSELGELVKIYWCIDKGEVDISPLSYPPVRKNGWIAAGLLRAIGNIEVLSRKNT